MTAKTVSDCLCQLFAIFGMPAYIHSDRGTSFMSLELKQFLNSHGISTSRTSRYNPQGNGQCERYNGIIWKTITLALKSKNLPVSQWETVLLDALHSVRSLLSTATNATPHERLFNYQRKSTSGHSVPTWLATPGPVWLKRQARQSKYEPIVDEVELLEANPQYAHVRFQDGREATVSVRHLAPKSEGKLGQHVTTTPAQTELAFHQSICKNTAVDNVRETGNDEPITNDMGIGQRSLSESAKSSITDQVQDSPNQFLRRSERVRKPPVRLDL